MCGRVNVSDLEGLNELIASIGAGASASLEQDLSPRWNIAPTGKLGVLHAKGNGYSLSPMRWGLDAGWETASGGAPRPLFNARSESVFEKPSFRVHVSARRALVPVNGYYEWQRNGKQRQAWHISPSASCGVLLAGFWNGAAQSPACCVLTRSASTQLSDIHHRMPVVIQVCDAMDWIRDASASQGLINSAEDPDLVPVRVTGHVNNARNDGPDCVQPALDDLIDQLGQ